MLKVLVIFFENSTFAKIVWVYARNAANRTIFSLTK